ncbi:MAG: hypothetical protein QMD82_04665 [bacterium]|nr:hypothetical protein [bacterium]
MKRLYALIFSIFLGLLMPSCIKKPVDNLVENLPPETYCFIAHVDTVDTVPAKVTLYWMGNDPDGEVSGFYYAIDGADTTFTTKTCDTFTFNVPSGDTFASHTFEVWAIDNEGMQDPTPAKVTIPVRNTPPVAFFIEDKLPPDTTLPVATFYFGATDIDGDWSIVGFLYRLDYEPDTVMHFVGIDSASVFLTDLPEGERTIYLCAVDESYALSDTVSHTWYVKPKVGDILLIDDANDSQADLFYFNFLEGYYPGGYTVYRVENGLPYSSLDVDYMINGLGFKLIIWYTADQSEHFSAALPSFTRYIDNGNKLILISPQILDVLLNPAFTPSPFAKDYLGVDSVTAWNKLLLRNEKLYPMESGYDTLSCGFPIISRFDGFSADSNSKVLYTLPTISSRWSGNPSVIIACPSSTPKVVFSSIQFHSLNGLENAYDVLFEMITDELGYTK